MANGRNTITRRGHNGGPFPGQGTSRRAQATARNRKPRKSSLEGVEARVAARLAAHPSSNRFPKSGPDNQTGRPPGSRNPRKLGRN